MSTIVAGWAWQHSPARSMEKYVHIAIADISDDDGYSRGDEYGSVDNLARRMSVNRKVVMDGIAALENAGELLVLRPTDRGGGRHNEMLVVMGRDRTALISRRRWPTSVDRSLRRTYLKGTAPGSAPTDSPGEGVMDRSPTPIGAHRGAQAAPPAACGEQVTEPVDGVASPSDDWSARRTDHPTDWSGTGPGLVPPSGHSPSLPVSQNIDLTDLAHGPHLDRARAAAVDIGELVGDVRRQLAALAPDTAGVRWDITARQRHELAVHALAWPTADAAADDWTITAAAAVAGQGRPFSARAWVAPWLATDPPAASDDESLCTEHCALGELAVPSRICAPCRTAAVVS